MHTELRSFLAHLLGTVTMTLVPVIFTAFISMPLSLERHPGETSASTTLSQHMT
jgi:hypothetical protein